MGLFDFLVLFIHEARVHNAVVSCVPAPRLPASPYLLRGRPQLRQAGCQVLGTLTQLHGRRLILHRGNG